MALQDELLDTSGALAKTIMGKAGTSTGLDPAVLQNLNTNAMETVPAQFRESQSNLATSLLRRGGGLPMGGEFLRAYGPLETAMINARSSGLRDVQLADQAERSRTFDMNNANALAAMGQANSLSTNLLDIGQREKLLTMQQDFQGKQSAADRAHAADLQAKVLANSITLADINNAPASVKSLLLSSLLSAGLSSAGQPGGGLIGSLISGGGTNGTGSRGLIGDLGGILGIGGGGGAAAGGAALGPLQQGIIPGMESVGPALAGPAGGGIGGALGSIGTLGGLVPLAAGIPIIGAGLAVAGKLLINSQQHRNADKLTGEGGIQYNLNADLKTLADQVISGQITQQQADPLRQQAFKGWAEKAMEFASKSGGNKTVVKQMMTSYDWDPALKALAAEYRARL